MTAIIVIAVLAAIVLAVVVVRRMRHHGFTLQEVSIYQEAASQKADNFVEITVAGCRLRKPLAVEVELERRFNPEKLREAIWRSVKRYDDRVSAVRFQGHTYSF